jgi:hypothetical protein
MLSFQGYFEAGQFVAEDSTTAIPEHRVAIVTILDKTAPQVDRRKIWQNFFETVNSAKEKIPAEFPRLNFNHKLDL